MIAVYKADSFEAFSFGFLAGLPRVAAGDEGRLHLLRHRGTKLLYGLVIHRVIELVVRHLAVQVNDLNDGILRLVPNLVVSVVIVVLLPYSRPLTTPSEGTAVQEVLE